MTRLFIAAAGLILLVGTGAPAADQWPQFRGALAGVASDDPELPDTWTETSNVAWRATVPGLGWSSPVVWGDQVFVTSAIDTSGQAVPSKGLFDPSDQHGSTTSSAVHRWMVYALDFKTGKPRWERELKSAVPPMARQAKNSYASETPVTDGERVYVYFGSIGVIAALDMSGTIVWTKDIGTFASVQGWGMAASPVLYKDLLIIVNDNKTGSFIAAFDKRTGSELWRTKRDEVEGWSTPFVWENESRPEIVTSGVRRVRSYGLDGKLLWEMSGMSSLSFGTIPTPFAAQGLVYLSSGYPGAALRPVYGIRPGGAGDISLKPGETSSPQIAWVQPLLGTYQTSALVYGDYFYTLLDRGFLLCNEARTGKQVYGRQRLSADTSGFAASPWAYNGKIFALSEDGETFVIQAGPEFKLLRKNSLNEMALATPAVARGSLFIRTQSKLYRITGAQAK